MKEGTLKTFFEDFFSDKGPLSVAINEGKKFVQGFIDKVTTIKDGIVNAFKGVLEIITKPFREAMKMLGEAMVAASKAGGIFSPLGGYGQQLIDASGLGSHGAYNPQYNEIRDQAQAHNANGGFNIKGWSMVGERGPEPAYFGSGGGRVIRSSRAQGVMGGNATLNLTVNNQTDGYTLMEQFIREAKRRNIVIEGLTS